MAEPLGGKVWDDAMPTGGGPSVVVLTINPSHQRLSSTTAVAITGTPGPRSTHIALAPDVGLTRYDESYAVATELLNVPLSAFRRPPGRLSRGEL